MKMPLEKSLFSKEPQTNQEILRAAIIAELDAINLYEQLANKTSDEKLKKILLDIVQEEKVHVGEFEFYLNSVDKENSESVFQGMLEANELLE